MIYIEITMLIYLAQLVVKILKLIRGGNYICLDIYKKYYIDNKQMKKVAIISSFISILIISSMLISLYCETTIIYLFLAGAFVINNDITKKRFEESMK